MTEKTKWAIEFTADAEVVHADGSTDTEDET